eukprot:c44216_g1_i1 orf=2-199(-)
MTMGLASVSEDLNATASGISMDLERSSESTSDGSDLQNNENLALNGGYTVFGMQLPSENALHEIYF